MRRYKFIVMSNAVEGSEDEFNRWYTEQHLPDVLAVPGIIAAERGQVAAGTDANGAARRYVAIYDIESSDIGATLADLGTRAGTDAMPMSEAIDRNNIATFTYEILPTNR